MVIYLAGSNLQSHNSVLPVANGYIPVCKENILVLWHILQKYYCQKGLCYINSKALFFLLLILICALQPEATKNVAWWIDDNTDDNDIIY